METNKVLNTDITSASAGKVIKKKDPRAVLFSVLLLLVSGAFMVAATYIEDRTSISYMSLMTLGIIGLLAAVFKLFFSSKRYFFLPTGSRVETDSLYIDPSELRSLGDELETGTLERLRKIKRLDNSGARLDVLVSSDRRFAAIQLFQYVPHYYEAVSPLYCYYDGDAQTVARHAAGNGN